MAGLAEPEAEAFWFHSLLVDLIRWAMPRKIFGYPIDDGFEAQGDSVAAAAEVEGWKQTSVKFAGSSRIQR
ncbi:hypothetical protein HN51_032599 [Arachis hypogaea]